NPTGNTLANTLTKIDFLRTSVNPTWWAYDVYNLNTRSARAMQHASAERLYGPNNFGTDTNRIQYTSGNWWNGFEHAGNPAIEILTVGGAGDTTDGQYLYGDTLTATNFSLYALRGNNIGSYLTNGDRVIYAEHWVYRATVFSPSTGAYLAPAGAALLSPLFGG